MKRVIRILLIVVCLCVMGYSGYQLYTIYSGYAQAENLYTDTAQQYVKPAPTRPAQEHDETKPEEQGDYAPIQVDFDALLQQNGDIVGWLYCPDTTLNYPVVQAEDNDYYLRRMLDGNYNHSGSIFMDYRCDSGFADFNSIIYGHNMNDDREDNDYYLRRMLDGNYNHSGSIFMDYRCDSGFADFNSIIYGHNMNDDSMFAVLAEYQDPQFCREHPSIYLLTPEADYRLNVMASVQTDANSDLYAFPSTREDFDEFLQELMDESILDVELDLAGVERTVLLSTCSYEFTDARYLVVGSVEKLDRRA